MKSKEDKAMAEVRRCRRTVSRKLAGLKGEALQEALAKAVRDVEAELGHPLPRHKGKMATPRRPLRLAQ